jgi:rhodanese-related sulfurtransferase
VLLPWWLPFGTVPETHPVRLAQLLGSPEEPQLLDVRTEQEFRRGHLRGAVSAPIGSLRRRLGEIGLDRSRPVVAICLSAHRSIPAVRLLRNAGFEATQLAGGMLAWRSAGFPEVEGT